MALTPSTMLALGTVAPEFSLADGTGRVVRLSDLGGRALVVMFICNHCPYVKHLREGLAKFGRDMETVGVSVVAVSANDPAGYPADAPARMVEESRSAGYTFPYLHDATQEVAKSYRAACTPDFFLFDGQRRLVYRGQFDDSRPGNGVAVTGKDLRGAVEALLAGRELAQDQKPSIGCNIKWRSGNEPEYA